jgi:hypothetical protein
MPPAKKPSAKKPLAKKPLAKKPSAKKGPASSASRPADPRVVRLMKALDADPEFAPSVRDLEARRASGERKFGSNGLKVNGKLYALFTQETLVVKLPRARVAALVAAKVGKPFDPGHGRVMKEWLAVTSPNASWIALAREAHAFVGAG